MYSRHDYEFLVALKKPGMCYAGFHSFYVREDGSVFPCGMGHYSESIGNLALSPELRMNDRPRPCPFQNCQCDTENMNTSVFHEHYRFTHINQHKYIYRFSEEAKKNPALDEWRINY